MKMSVEAREKVCSDWLGAVRAPIAKTKNHNYRLKTHYGNRQIKHFERNMLLNDILLLHCYTLIAWQTVFEDCQRVKCFFIKFQDNFLRIMLNNLVTVCDKLFYVLLEIDEFLRRKQAVYLIFQKFAFIKSTDILTTWELREQETSSDEQDMKESIFYLSCEYN